MGIVANVVAALADFTKSRFATETAVEVEVPQTWLPTLGILKTAGQLPQWRSPTTLTG
jgi:hypothetical protein